MEEFLKQIPVETANNRSKDIENRPGLRIRPNETNRRNNPTMRICHNEIERGNFSGY